MRNVMPTQVATPDQAGRAEFRDHVQEALGELAEQRRRA
jgi:hypothetical protein